MRGEKKSMRRCKHVGDEEEEDEEEEEKEEEGPD